MNWTSIPTKGPYPRDWIFTLMDPSNRTTFPEKVGSRAEVWVRGVDKLWSASSQYSEGTVFDIFMGLDDLNILTIDPTNMVRRIDLTGISMEKRGEMIYKIHRTGATLDGTIIGTKVHPSVGDVFTMKNCSVVVHYSLLPEIMTCID